MIDIKWIRQEPEAFEKAMERRGLNIKSSDVLDLDENHRELLTKSQELQSERNAIAKKIGMLKAKGEDATAIINRASEIKETLPRIEDEAKKCEVALYDMIASLPNVLLDIVPDGNSEDDNKEVSRHGVIPSFSFTPKSHYEIGEDLGMMDFETAAKVSGSRFVYLKKDLAKMERALASFMLDLHVNEFGYDEVTPPYLVRDHSLFGTGQLPKFTDTLFKTAENHWLIPTAEVPLTNMVRESILDEGDLPKRLVAVTPCFRSESDSTGKDTKGMIRQHQFTKVELVSIVHPDHAMTEHDRMLGAACEVLQKLGLAYKVIELCSGDTGATSKRTFDIEVWLPSENRYREISSCSICGDYQARRMKARFRPSVAGENDSKKAKTEFVNTLNGSGVAVGRALVAIIENYQNEDGSIAIPDVLVPYMGGKKVIAK